MFFNYENLFQKGGFESRSYGHLSMEAVLSPEVCRCDPMPDRPTLLKSHLPGKKKQKKKQVPLRNLLLCKPPCCSFSSQDLKSVILNFLVFQIYGPTDIYYYLCRICFTCCVSIFKLGTIRN